MIEGLRLLPWVMQRRADLRDKGNLTSAKRWANCYECREHVPYSTRVEWACGFVPEHRRGTGVLAPHGASVEATVCCGYSTQLPEVREVGRALAWRRDGQLQQFCGAAEVTSQLRDYVDILDIEMRHAEATALRESMPKNNGSSR